MIVANNIAGGLGGSTVSARWVDVYKKVDTRTGEEIAAEVIKNAGLIPKGGDE